MRSAELYSLTLTSAVKMIQDGKLSPLELTESLLGRINKTEKSIHAYVTICKEEALEYARDLEKSGNNARLKPLRGVPMTIKDLIKTAGIKTTAGSKILINNVPDLDATVVRNLRKAGAFVLGKSNTHEFALGGVTPPTKNPWNTKLIPGGSSGGSAAAVAASSAIASLGTDTGGSIRVPASYCGVVGLKPTYGRVSRWGVYPESWSLDHVGPITKTVEDAALLLNVISGYDPLDPNSANRPVPNFLDSIRDGVKGIRIGVPDNYFFDHVESSVLPCVKEAISQVQRLGGVVVPFKFPDIEKMMAAYTAIDSAEVSAFHERFYHAHKDLYQPDAREYIELGFLVTATQYLKAQRARKTLTNRILSVFDKVDVIVTPTQPIVAQRPDLYTMKFENFEEPILFSMIRFLAPFNLTGLPAITINCGFASSLPVGLQIVGKLFDEENLLRVAHAYERSTNWHISSPPLV